MSGLSRPWPELGWVAVDVEGNGQQPPDLVEVACLPIDAGQPGPVRTWLVSPPRPVTATAARIHRISNQDLAAAPPVGNVAGEVRAALAGRVVVGHNVTVDIGVLRRELPGWQPEAALDTLALARWVWPALRSYRLDALAAHARLATPPQATGSRHRAGHDAVLAAALFTTLARAAASDPDRTVSAARLLRLASPRPAGPHGPALF